MIEALELSLDIGCAIEHGVGKLLALENSWCEAMEIDGAPGGVLHSGEELPALGPPWNLEGRAIALQKSFNTGRW